MKKKLFIALLIPVIASGCIEDDPDIIEDDNIAFTVEATIPEGTPASDILYICGPCLQEPKEMAPKLARLRTVWLETKDFAAGKTLKDGFWFESERYGRELDSDGSQLTRTLEAADGGIYKLTVAQWTKPMAEDISAQMLAGKWLVVGTMNEWRLSLGFEMEQSGDSRICKDLNCSGKDSFKLVLGDSWLVNFGFGEPNTTSTVGEGSITLERDGGSIQPERGMYAISFNPVSCGLTISRTGDYIGEPEPDTWAVVGAFGGWDISTSFPMGRQKNGLYKASYVDLQKATSADGENAGFMFVRNGVMEEPFGLEGGGTITLESETPVVANGERILVPENGYYDIVFNPMELTVYIAGSASPSVTSWSVVGKFNEWDQSSGIPMYSTGDWFVAKNVYLTSVKGETGGMGFKFVKDKSWDTNRGVSGFVGGEGGHMLVGLDEEISLSQGGGNIQLEEEGSYDIYLHSSTDKAYVLKAGDRFQH